MFVDKGKDLWSGLIYNTSARYERHEWDMSDTIETRARQNGTSATQVRRENYTNDTNVTGVLHERHESYTSEKGLQEVQQFQISL